MARTNVSTLRTGETRLTRQEELELHFRRFPDVPPEVIVKEDILRHGLTYSPGTLQNCEGYSMFFMDSRRKSYHLYTRLETMKEQAPEQRDWIQAPSYLFISGGPYDLRATCVHVRLTPGSPYLVDRVEGDLVICGDGVPVAKVTYPPVPNYQTKAFADGTRYADLVSLYFGHNPNVASVTCSRHCHYFAKGMPCKFCDFGSVANDLEKLGVTWSLVKGMDRVADVMETVFKEETGPTTPISYCLTGGTMADDADGVDDTTFYLGYLTAIKERIGNRWPAILMIEAKPEADIKRFAETGTVSLQSNMEVWDKDLFPVMCPGKAQKVGRDEWVRRLVAAVDILGQGNVMTNFVAGVELAQPYGFREVDAAVKSTTEGLDFLMSHGVLPTLCVWIPEPGSVLGTRHEPVPLEYLIRVDQAWYELWKKYWLPPPWIAAGPIGPGRSIYGVSGILDVGY